MAASTPGGGGSATSLLASLIAPGTARPGTYAGRLSRSARIAPDDTAGHADRGGHRRTRGALDPRSRASGSKPARGVRPLLRPGSDGLRGAARLVDHRPAGLLVGAPPSSSGSGSPNAPTAVLGERSMPGARWFPGATLNYAEHALAAGPGRGDDDLAMIFVREDGLERMLRFGELRAQVGRARAGLVGSGRPARRPGGGAGAQLPGDPGLLPRRGQPRRDLVVLLAGLRGPRRPRPVRPDRARRTARRGRLPATAARRSTSCRPSTKLRAQLPTLRATVLLPYLDDGCRSSRARCRGPSSPPTAASWRSTRCRSTTRCGCSTPRAPPACRRASCTGTAAWCSST